MFTLKLGREISLGSSKSSGQEQNGFVASPALHELDGEAALERDLVLLKARAHETNPRQKILSVLRWSTSQQQLLLSVTLIRIFPIAI